MEKKLSVEKAHSGLLSEKSLSVSKYNVHRPKTEFSLKWNIRYADFYIELGQLQIEAPTAVSKVKNELIQRASFTTYALWPFVMS